MLAVPFLEHMLLLQLGQSQPVAKFIQPVLLLQSKNLIVHLVIQKIVTVNQPLMKLIPLFQVVQQEFSVLPLQGCQLTPLPE